MHAGSTNDVNAALEYACGACRTPKQAITACVLQAELPYFANTSSSDTPERISLLLNDDSLRKVAIMNFALRQCSILLLAVVLIAGLAACSTTDTGSTAAIEESSLGAPEPEASAETAKAEEAPAAEEAPVTPEASPSSETSVAEQAAPEEKAVESEPSGATTGAAEQAETVEPMEFPVQKYQIDEPVAAETQNDAEIDRLRQELAATESELDKMRAEEESRKYSTSEAASSAESSGTNTESTGSETQAAPMPPQQTPSNAQVAESKAPMEPKSRPDVSSLPDMPSETSVYFDFDQAVVGSQYETVIVSNANFLKDHPDLKVEIQGNCDERGSREYNIALGQRRAETIKQALELLGVNGARIETVSFGSEKPAAFGHDETSWRLNRRADLVYSY